MDDTFYLSNIVPQNIDNNSGFWNRLETYCRDLTEQFDKVHVISGPLYQVNDIVGDKKFVKYEVSYSEPLTSYLIRGWCGKVFLFTTIIRAAIQNTYFL